MTDRRPNDLILSEALFTLVDQGEMSEGSEAYRVAQKVVRDGEAALDPAEREVWEAAVKPLLAR